MKLFALALLISLQFSICSYAYGSDVNSIVPSAYRQIAAEYSIPPALLYSIALTESKNNYKGLTRPWPWTMNHRGNGMYFETKAEAISHAKKLIADGDKNFDVCVMQINWRWHNRRFSSIKDAFDPYKCIRAAAQIVADYKKQYGSFEIAVGKYHSPGNKELAHKYKERVRRNLALLFKDNF